MSGVELYNFDRQTTRALKWDRQLGEYKIYLEHDLKRLKMQLQTELVMEQMKGALRLKQLICKAIDDGADEWDVAIYSRAFFNYMSVTNRIVGM